MFVLFVLIVASVFFLLLAWGAATAYRICFPERPLPFEQDAAVIRHRARAAGRRVPVGVREIREDQRRSQQEQARAYYQYYHYAWGSSAGLPAGWKEDLWCRRN